MGFLMLLLSIAYNGHINSHSLARCISMGQHIVVAIQQAVGIIAVTGMMSVLNGRKLFILVLFLPFI
jgi:hypothetical protein